MISDDLLLHILDFSHEFLYENETNGFVNDGDLSVFHHSLMYDDDLMMLTRLAPSRTIRFALNALTEPPLPFILLRCLKLTSGALRYCN